VQWLLQNYQAGAANGRGTYKSLQKAALSPVCVSNLVASSPTQGLRLSSATATYVMLINYFKKSTGEELLPYCL
jgi:hypothetical protein